MGQNVFQTFLADCEFGSGHVGDEGGFAAAGGSEDEVAFFYVSEGGQSVFDGFDVLG